MSNKLGAILAFLLVLSVPALATRCTAFNGVDSLPLASAIAEPAPLHPGEAMVFSVDWTKCFDNETFSQAYVELDNATNISMTGTFVSGQTWHYTYTGYANLGVNGYRYVSILNTTREVPTDYYSAETQRSLGGIDATWAGIIVILAGIAVLCWAFFPLYGMVTKKKIDYGTVLMLMIGLMIAFALISALLTI